MVRVGSPRSLRIAFGGRIARFWMEIFLVRVGAPRCLRSTFGGRIVRVGAPCPNQQGDMCTQHMLLHARSIRTETCACDLFFASRWEVA
jgi:hypothetical protein